MERSEAISFLDCFVALLLAIVDVRYIGDSLFGFKWPFKKLPKSIPKALKKDLGLGLN